MNFEFLLPDLGEGLTEGEIVKWFVKEGDAIKEHAPLAAVLTDKAEVEIPSPKSGAVLKLYGKPGEKVKVHAPLALLEVGGAGTPAPKASAPAPAAKPAAKPAPAQAPTPPPSAGYVFNLPDLGEGLTEGELVKWHVKEGEKIAEHRPLASVLTDKAEVEIPSPKTGTIAKLHAKPGEKVKVHAPLVTFGGVAGEKPAAAPEPARLEKPAPRTALAPRPAARPTEVLATPMVRKLAKDLDVDLAQVQGTGPQGRVLEADLRAFKGAPAAQSATADAASANATPAVKALAKELGVDLPRLKGSGPGGRVVEGDVRAAAPAGPRAATSTPAPKPAGTAIPSEPGDERRPFVGIRRKIAERMVFSRHTVAHVTHMDECDMSALLVLREELKPEAAKRGVKLTFLPFIVKALTRTLQDFPLLNASIDDTAGEIVIKKRVNIGIAVAAPQGLVVPNIKDAGNKDLWAMAKEISALAEDVRANKIALATLQGGTFTITNIGPIGGLFATPIVNHPEAAILGLMKLQKRPVYRENEVHVRDMMNLVLSFDHRIVDGADAAHFMNALIQRLENPRTLI